MQAESRSADPSRTDAAAFAWCGRVLPRPCPSSQRESEPSLNVINDISDISLFLEIFTYSGSSVARFRHSSSTVRPRGGCRESLGRFSQSSSFIGYSVQVDLPLNSNNDAHSRNDHGRGRTATRQMSTALAGNMPRVVSALRPRCFCAITMSALASLWGNQRGGRGRRDRYPHEFLFAVLAFRRPPSSATLTRRSPRSKRVEQPALGGPLAPIPPGTLSPFAARSSRRTRPMRCRRSSTRPCSSARPPAATAHLRRPRPSSGHHHGPAPHLDLRLGLAVVVGGVDLERAGPRLRTTRWTVRVRPPGWHPAPRLFPPRLRHRRQP